MSLLGSVPTTVNGAVLPSAKVTLVSGDACAVSPPRPATTWLLVRISPSVDRMTPEPSSDCAAHVDLQLHDAGHHLGGDLLDRTGRQAGGGHARRRTAIALHPGDIVVGVRQHRDAAADTGRDHRDRHRARCQSPCARTLPGPAALASGRGYGPGPTASARRGTGRRAPEMSAAAGAEWRSASRRAAAARSRCGRLTGHLAVHAWLMARLRRSASTSGGSSCRCDALPRVVRVAMVQRRAVRQSAPLC